MQGNRIYFFFFFAKSNRAVVVLENSHKGVFSLCFRLILSHKTRYKCEGFHHVVEHKFKFKLTILESKGCMQAAGRGPANEFVNKSPAFAIVWLILVWFG